MTDDRLNYYPDEVQAILAPHLEAVDVANEKIEEAQRLADEAIEVYAAARKATVSQLSEIGMGEEIEEFDFLVFGLGSDRMCFEYHDDGQWLNSYQAEW